MMTAPDPFRPMNFAASPAAASMVRTTWKVPSPKTYFCIARSLSKLSSRPMLNRRKITPSSAMCRTAVRLLMMPSAFGPKSAPPRRNPRTGLPPGILEMSGTTTTLVARSHSVSVRPDSASFSSTATASASVAGSVGARRSFVTEDTVCWSRMLEILLATVETNCLGWFSTGPSPLPPSSLAESHTPDSITTSKAPANLFLRNIRDNMSLNLTFWSDEKYAPEKNLDDLADLGGGVASTNSWLSSTEA
mmetsp:Transcript_15088/g.38363  ORF Transcript_15088/g.38363 Transcript_15088/m.38363 type:complete len:248 (-) Transcript_15088:507-1250(-)